MSTSWSVPLVTTMLLPLRNPLPPHHPPMQDRRLPATLCLPTRLCKKLVSSSRLLLVWNDWLKEILPKLQLPFRSSPWFQFVTNWNDQPSFLWQMWHCMLVYVQWRLEFDRPFCNFVNIQKHLNWFLPREKYCPNGHVPLPHKPLKWHTNKSNKMEMLYNTIYYLPLPAMILIHNRSNRLVKKPRNKRV